MLRLENIEIEWHAVGEVCKMYALAYGAAFLALAILNSNPEFKRVAQASPWIPKYLGDLLAFAVTMIMIWRASRGNFGSYGFTLKRRSLMIGTALGIGFALLWVLWDYSLQAVTGNVESQAAYARTATNVAGMLSFQWIAVGILEEPLARGLAQTRLMSEMKGAVYLFGWKFHVGTVFAGILFGVGHVIPYLFFGQPWLFLGSEVVGATLFGLLAGYVYQETRSLAGPIVMHNIVDGLLHTVALFY
jgi:membrane protease YdiL (CAAX protease family)